jgi:hypothetical protein
MSKLAQDKLLKKITTQTNIQSNGRLLVDDLSLNLAEAVKENESLLNGYTVAIIKDSNSHSEAASLRNSGNEKILFVFAEGKNVDSYFSSCANKINIPNNTLVNAEKEVNAEKKLLKNTDKFLSSKTKQPTKSSKPSL